MYISTVAQDVTAADIERLIVSSRLHDRQLDLTGALVACAQRFAHLLEGREAKVDLMMAKIATDKCPTDMRVLARMEVFKRLCAH